MPECIYDNPTTMHREIYIDGDLVASFNCNLFMQKPALKLLEQATSIKTDSLQERTAKRLYQHLGIWKTGQIIGDETAMEDSK